MSNENISSIISGLKKINESKSETIKLPISKLEVSLTPLQAKHIAKIHSSLLAGSDGSHTLRFPSLVHSLFSDILTLPDDKSYSDFDLIDYHYILFKISEMTNDELEVMGKDEEIFTVNIQDKLKGLSKVKKSKSITVGDKACSITLECPSYHRSFRLDRIIEERAKKDESKIKKNMSDVEVESMIKDQMSVGLLKFVSKLKTIHDNEEIEFDFQKESIKDQQAILDLIPREFYKAIFDGIESISEPIKNLVSTDVEGVTIPLDQTLFISSD